jgi:drug/metabolite transporter (DMT)-like permease
MQALFGWIAFGEKLSSNWFVGAAMMSVGVFFVVRGTTTIIAGAPSSSL